MSRIVALSKNIFHNEKIHLSSFHREGNACQLSSRDETFEMIERFLSSSLSLYVWTDLSGYFSSIPRQILSSREARGSMSNKCWTNVEREFGTDFRPRWRRSWFPFEKESLSRVCFDLDQWNKNLLISFFWNKSCKLRIECFCSHRVVKFIWINNKENIRKYLI